MLEFTLQDQPDITTSRLLLRKQSTSDAAVLFSLRTHPEVMRYIDRPKPSAVADSQAVIHHINEDFMKGKNVIWAITFKESPDQMIGNLGFWRTDLENHRAEIGYMLHPDYWRQGILSEALSAVIDFGFNSLNLHSICANINPGNEASRQLLLKHGFIKEAYFREDYYFEGKFLDSEIYGLLKEKD